MRFDIPTYRNPNIEKYLKEEYDIAYKFSQEMYKEFGRFVACTALFGSAAKPQARKEVGDIDVLVVVDDLKLRMNEEVVEVYRVITDKIVAQTSRKLHITSLKLTAFWEYVRAGDPIVINILRDGVSLIDNNLFDPLQVLLRQGRIRPSEESIWNYFTRAPVTIHNSKWHIMQAALDLYWAVIDSAHAVLMRMGEVPPSPEHVADLLEEKLVKRNLLEREYAQTMREFYKLQKMITHREIKEISGQEYDTYLHHAQKFIARMNELVEIKP
ncbi:nucleotidyltransferase domain-containing protein [Candidatus Woesearchaeota archaeon]|nr:nucleotidyltransferase domain-containing protein [Candidatus Woesearchaeota archaeon]